MKGQQYRIGNISHQLGEKLFTSLRRMHASSSYMCRNGLDCFHQIKGHLKNGWRNTLQEALMRVVFLRSPSFFPRSVLEINSECSSNQRPLGFPIIFEIQSEQMYIHLARGRSCSDIDQTDGNLAPVFSASSWMACWKATHLREWIKMTTMYTHSKEAR